jgi:hypothetical protein
MGSSIRESGNPSGSKNVSKKISTAGNLSNIQILYQAVVTDVFSNPANLSIKQKNVFKSDPFRGVSNPSSIDTMPRNSIAAVIVNDTTGAAMNDVPMILYPFFSSHLAMPIKPGERVFVIFPTTPNPANSASSLPALGFWVTRITTNIKVDDTNYTHQDRIPPSKSDATLIDLYSGVEEGILSFPNGSAGDAGTRTFPVENFYEQIVESSYALRTIANDVVDTWEGTVGQSSPIAAAEFTGEVVPRFSKQCSDLILQGSNNTLIRLGRDTAPIARDSVVPDDTMAATGTIDLVAGRGAELSEAGALPTPIVNTRGYEETNKDPLIATPLEGDEDLINDLSRVYISMKTDPDSNFGLIYSHTTATAVTEKPAIIIKSDEIRLVARETGSVRLVKEGGTTGGFCEISMLADNTVAMEGSKVYLGLNSLGVETQPAVMGKLLETALHDFADDLLAALITDPCGNLATPLVDISFTTTFADLKEDVTKALSSTVFVKD